MVPYIISQYPSDYKFTVAEIGVAQANNAKVWCKNMNLKQLVLVDNCSDKFGNVTPEECLTEVGKILKQYDFTVFHNLDSAEAARLYEDEYFDYVYLDGDHTFNGVWEDLVAWKDKVKKGGFLSGHDYDKNDNVKPGFDYVLDDERFPHCPSSHVFHVKPAVVKFCSSLKAEVVELPSGEYAIKRTW